jgi:signal transduction histidine kinase
MNFFALSIVETACHPLLILDEDLRVVVANDSFYRNFGCDRSGIKGHSLFEIGSSRWDQPRLRVLLDKFIRREGTFKNIEVECDIPSLGRRGMVLNAHWVAREGDPLPMVLLAIEDDTERQRARDELRQSIIDLQYQLEVQTQKADDLIKSVEATRQQTLIQTDRKIDALEQKACEKADVVEAVRENTCSKAETEIALLVQQARDLADSVETIREVTLEHSDSQIAALVHSELVTRTLNEELERRVLERTRQLETANRELEAFCYSISHDLRAPLRALDGFSQELLMRYADGLDKQGQHYLRRVRVGTQRMGCLIDDLLKLSRVTRSDMRSEWVDLTSLAEAVFAELRELDPKREVTFTARPGLSAEGDPSLIRIVLENLLGNAWKFTAKNPTALIAFDRTQVQGRPAFVVRDDGAGFDMAYADKLFRAFQRLHSDREFAGTGIGLATVHRILQRHGGEVWAEGAVGRGAAFSFTIPGSEVHS